jgi:hypothetical protein
MPPSQSRPAIFVRNNYSCIVNFANRFVDDKEAAQKLTNGALAALWKENFTKDPEVEENHLLLFTCLWILNECSIDLNYLYMY